MDAPPTADDVLDAAGTLLREGGPRALSMRRLADALGCSYQVVYSRIGDKAAVVRALHDRGLERLTATARQRLPDDATAAIEHVAVGYLRAAIADPILFEVMFGAPIDDARVRDDPGAVDIELRSFRACWVEPARRWYEDRGGVRPEGSATRLAYRLWTAVHGITVVHLAGHRSPSGDVEREVRETVAAVLRSAERDR